MLLSVLRTGSWPAGIIVVSIFQHTLYLFLALEAAAYDSALPRHRLLLPFLKSLLDTSVTNLNFCASVRRLAQFS